MAKPFYSLEEVADLLGKSNDEITALVRAGDLREFRDSGKVFFKAEDVEKLRKSGDSGEITLDSVDADSSDSLPTLVDTSGGTSIIGLSDMDDAESGGSGAPAAKEGTSLPSGIGVFDDDELELDDDPMAATQVTAAAGAPGSVSLEGTGSGSGLLDLTREADDTSLGAELLDEIYPGEDDAAASKAGSRTGSAAKSAAGASRGGTAIEDAADEEDEEAVEEEEVLVPAQRTYAVAYDPLEGMFSFMLIAALIILGIAGAVQAAVMQGYVPDYGVFLANRFWIFIAGAVGILGLLTLIGFLIGRSGARRV
ncbi:MAG: helix-turn-helix domain-containing protein [Phycisphaerae bacterium]